MARWQFQDFYKENLRSNEEFRCTVEKMITAEEKTRERFPDKNNQDYPDKRNHQNVRHQERKHGPDNTVEMADKSRKFSKPRGYDNIENMRCILHPKWNHTISDCYTFNDRYTRKDSKGSVKEDNQKEEEDKGFQKSRGIVAVIFAWAPDYRSKHQEKLALRTIMAAEPATPRYLNWSQYPIQFSREDQWSSVGNVGHYPLVLDPTIIGMTVTKVLIDGGAGLNIIFLETLRKMGLQLIGMITPTITPFLWDSTR